MTPLTSIIPNGSIVVCLAILVHCPFLILSVCHLYSLSMFLSWLV